MAPTPLNEPPTPGIGSRLLRRLLRGSTVARELAAVDAEIEAEAETEPLAVAATGDALERLIYRRKPPRRRGNGRARWRRDTEIGVRFQPGLRRWLATEYGPLAAHQYRRVRCMEAERVEALLESLTIQRVAEGDGLYWLNEPAGMVYLVRRGRIALHCDAPLPETPIATIGAGDLVGEMEVILNVGRRTSAVALEESEIFCLPAHLFLDALRASEPLRDSLIPLMQERLTAYLEHQPPTKENRMLAFVADGGFFNAGKMMVCELDRCIDCHACEEACEARHGILRLTQRTEARLGAVALPTTCKACISPGCISGCKKEAIRLLDDGRIHIDPDRCIGCQACAKGCHFGVIDMVERPEPPPAAPAEGTAEGEKPKKKKPKKRAVKCDQCAGYDHQACVRECPTGALRFVDPVTYLLRVNPT